jgi:katanin p60 ATPase-containing subunit A1
LKGIPLSEESEGKIDWEHLVKVTEGYSGADISNVCRDASMMPMRRKMQSSQFDIRNIHAMQDEIDIPLTM